MTGRYKMLVHARYFFLCIFCLLCSCKIAFFPTGPFRVGDYVAEFDTPFLADLNNGELSEKHLYDGIEGKLNVFIILFVGLLHLL